MIKIQDGFFTIIAVCIIFGCYVMFLPLLYSWFNVYIFCIEKLTGRTIEISKETREIVFDKYTNQ